MIYRFINHLYVKQSHTRTLRVVSLARAFLNNLLAALNTTVLQKYNSTTKPGTSANAGPHYQKLFARVTHIWGNRKGQPNRSAMRGPHLERTASLITVPPASGKYFLYSGGPRGAVRCPKAMKTKGTKGSDKKKNKKLG